jgi:hypothetical protein
MTYTTKPAPSYLASLAAEHDNPYAQGTGVHARTADDVVTLVTGAGSAYAATAILEGTRRVLLLAVADLLHIEADGHGNPWLRKAILAEARA